MLGGRNMERNDKKSKRSICKQCGKESSGKKYCCKKCGTDWVNKNRVLTPNLFITCEICGKKVERYISPYQQKRDGPTRFCSRTCAGKWRNGENHPMWNGGEVVDRDGYVYSYDPYHPYVNARGYVFRHRLVMEKMIGRYLESQEVVHHKNDTPGDDRPENLHLYASNADHKREDAKLRERDELGRFLPKGTDDVK
jgi:hypothetical protein